MLRPISKSAGLLLLSALPLFAQQGPPASAPERFPYTFSNFVWWTAPELRTELKRRVPGLREELVPRSTLEAHVREALTAMLRSKGIVANVLVEDPGPAAKPFNPDALPFFHAPVRTPPRQRIVFSVLAPPEIIVGKLVLDGAPAGAGVVLRESATQMEGRPLNEAAFPSMEEEISGPLKEAGHLSATVSLSHGTPEKLGQRYVVPIIAHVDTGPQYRVGTLTIDGGPLLRGRDLMAAAPLHPGDLASSRALARFEMAMVSVYTRQGFLRAHVDDAPVLDPEHGTATYHLLVVPGTQFHLGDLTVRHLSGAQEARVRELLGLHPNDIYDQSAVDSLYTKIKNEPSLHGLEFSFSPQVDRAKALVNLVFDFYKGDGSIPTGTVTTH